MQIPTYGGPEVIRIILIRKAVPHVKAGYMLRVAEGRVAVLFPVYQLGL